MNSSKMETFLPKVILAITIFAICIVRSETSTNFKTIQTRNGKVRGIRKTTLIHKVVFYSFKGIPYAKSPTGELRFKVSFSNKIYEVIVRQRAFLFLPNCAIECDFINDSLTMS